MYPNSPGGVVRELKTTIHRRLWCNACLLENHSSPEISKRQSLPFKKYGVYYPVHETTGYRDPAYRYSDQYQYREHRQFSTGHLLRIIKQ